MTSIQVHPVPRGWRRVVAVDAVYYVSPDKCVLWNRHDVLKHLTSWGTCKCGLQCPVDVDIVFSFNRDVPTGLELPSPTGSCTHMKTVKSTEVETTQSDNLVTCDPQEVDNKDDESQKTDNNVVEETDTVTVQDLEISEFLGTENSSRFHSLEELVSQCIQEADKHDISDSTAQEEIENTEFLCTLNDGVQTNADDDTLLDISPQETQVFAISRSNVEDNLLTVDNTEIDAKVLCAPQEEHAGSSSVQSVSSIDNLPVTEKLSSPPIVASCEQQDPPSPQKLSLKEFPSPHPQKSPSPQKSKSPLSPTQKLPSSDKSPHIINIMSLTPREIDALLSARETVSRVQLVDYDYEADSDSANDDVAMESNGVTLKNKKPVVDYGSTDDSTDTISYDSDSNSLVDEKFSADFTSTEDSNCLTHDLSDTGTVSCDEKMEPHTDVKKFLETTVLSSPPLSCTKIVAQKSNLASIPPEVDMPPSIMDVNTFAEEKTKVHTVETCKSVSTISTMTVPPVSVEVSPSISTPLVSALTASPVFCKTTQSVYPVTSMDTTILTATVSGSLSSVTDNPPCNDNSSTSSVDTTILTSTVTDSPPCIENPSTSLIPTTTSVTCQTFEDTFVANKGTSVTSKQSPVHAADDSEVEGIVQPLVNFTTDDFALPSMVQNPVNYSGLPISSCSNELPVFAVPDSVPNTCSSSISSFDLIQSTSIPFPSSQACNSSVNDSLTVTMTQAPSQTSTAETSHVPNDNTDDVGSTVSSNESNDRVTDSTQSFDNCQIEKKDGSVSDPDVTSTADTAIHDDGGDRSVNKFPAALKLSIDLSVLPHKKKVLQRAKWAALLTTPVPVLRERKKPLKSTVTVKSTIIKSDRKPKTESSSSPKKQLQEPDSTNQHTIGKVRWCKFSYWDPWPCRIIVHSDVDQPEPPPDQVWVEWYGEHSYSKVDRASLKPYEEGLQLYLSNKSKKRKDSRKLKHAVAEVRSLVEGISTAKASTKKKKRQPRDVRKDSASVEKEGCPS